MFTFLSELAAGIVLGLSLAAPPGPVNAMVATSSVKSPFKGAAIGFGALTADAIFMVITIFFLSVIPQGLVKVFWIVGGALMFYLAFMIAKSKFEERSMKGSYAVGLTMGITNPMQIGWWLTAGVFLISDLSLFAVAGLFVGIILWIFGFSQFIHRARHLYEPDWIRILSVVCLALFGAYMLYSGAVAYL